MIFVAMQLYRAKKGASCVQKANWSFYLASCKVCKHDKG